MNDAKWVGKTDRIENLVPTVRQMLEDADAMYP